MLHLTDGTVNSGYPVTMEEGQMYLLSNIFLKMCKGF